MFPADHVVQVKGKSIRGIKAVHVIMDEELKQAIDKIVMLRHKKAPYTDYNIFAR